MTQKNILLPVKRILRVINDCQTQEQIDDCRIIVQNYVKSARKNDVINAEDLKNRLEEEISQRQEEIMLVKIFNDNI